MSKIVLWGASGHACVIVDILSLAKRHELVGFLDEARPDRRGEIFCGKPILGGREEWPRLLAAGVNQMIVAIGQCAVRLHCATAAGAAGFTFAQAIHPSAVVAGGVRIGPGTVIMAGAVVNPETTIGAHTVVNTGASVDHHCMLEDGVHVSPGAHLAGGVSVGEGSWIGIGAIIKEKIRVGRNAVIGAGSVVLRDIPDDVVAWGSPARVMKANKGI